MQIPERFTTRASLIEYLRWGVRSVVGVSYVDPEKPTSWRVECDPPADAYQQAMIDYMLEGMGEHEKDWAPGNPPVAPLGWRAPGSPLDPPMAMNPPNVVDLLLESDMMELARFMQTATPEDVERWVETHEIKQIVVALLKLLCLNPVSTTVAGPIEESGNAGN